MSYPLHMYKGSYTASAINAEEKIVIDVQQEKSARKAGFVDGREFFSQPPAVEEVK
ncbi:MAG: hypothetical protein JWQ87_2247 [Candidatus Sulfotelmatobacter sp.]|nr:hypothetical protein [Candidatus Sulfotelmatobacter sp.]